VIGNRGEHPCPRIKLSRVSLALNAGLRIYAS